VHDDAAAPCPGKNKNATGTATTGPMGSRTGAVPAPWLSHLVVQHFSHK